MSRAMTVSSYQMPNTTQRLMKLWVMIYDLDCSDHFISVHQLVNSRNAGLRLQSNIPGNVKLVWQMFDWTCALNSGTRKPSVVLPL